jgi:hypothetical protein
MRYRRWMLAVVVLVVVASALVAADRPPAAPFEFELQRTSAGVALKCHHGCNWMSLTGGCDKADPSCSFVVNEHGIRTLPASGQPTPSSH